MALLLQIHCTCVPSIGKMVEKKVIIKISLLKIRQQMLKDQRQYMHLLSDSELSELTESELTSTLINNHVHVSSNQPIEDLQKQVAKIQRTRSLVIWHDHAEILGTGFIMITVNTIYDTVVFLTKEQYMERSEHPIANLQSVVEQPYMYMIAAGSSSAEDQAALIADRVDCLYDLKDEIMTDEGIPVRDIMHFFKGDTPAKQFERGTQKGGYYKCGSCGCHSDVIDDLTCALQCTWRSLSEIQSLALAGKYGDTPNVIKPFESLDTAELQQELRFRNVYHEATNKKDLRCVLADTLKGVQRVPTLLLGNPTENLVNLNLQYYTVLDSEPLHDIKGHLIHLFINLPSVISGEIKELCEQIISSNQRKEKLTCADLRLTAIQVYLALAEKCPANSTLTSNSGTNI